MDTNYFTTEQSERYHRIQTNSEYKSFYFIEVNDLVRDSSYEGILGVKLPDSSHIGFNFKYVTDADQHFVWYGDYKNIEDDTVCEWGNLLFISDTIGKFGSFTTNFLNFEIIDLSDDLQVLAALDTASITGICGMPDSLAEEPISSEILHNRTNTPCQIRVHFTYTSDAAAKVASVEQRAQLDIEWANVVIKNSRINPSSAQFVYSGTTPGAITDFTFHKYLIDDDVKDLTNSEDLETLRDFFNADIVVVYIPGGWFDPIGDIIGRVGDIGIANHYDPPQLSDDWLASDIEVSTKVRVFAHEAGHIIGAHHEYATDYTGPSYAHAFTSFVYVHHTIGSTNIIVPRPIRTQMFSVASSSNIPYYSNPNVKFLNLPIGTSNAYNARIVTEEGCATSELQSWDYSLTAYITGLDEIEYQHNDYLIAEVSGGSEPYSYDWYISFDGIHYSSLSDYDYHTTIYANYPVGTRFIVKLIVTDENNKVSIDYLSVEVVEEFNPHFQQLKPAGAILTCSPNPTSKELEVSFIITDSNNESINLILITSSGQFVSKNELGKLTPGKYKYSLNTGKYAQGSMIISLMDKDNILDSKQIVKLE